MLNSGEEVAMLVSAPTTMELALMCFIPILILGLTILCIVLAIMKKSWGFATIATSGIMVFGLMGLSATGAFFNPSIPCAIIVITALAGIVMVIVEYVGKSNDTNVIMMQQVPIQHVVVTEVQPQAANNEGRLQQDEISEIKSTINALNERLDTIASESEEP